MKKIFIYLLLFVLAFTYFIAVFFMHRSEQAGPGQEHGQYNNYYGDTAIIPANKCMNDIPLRILSGADCVGPFNGEWDTNIGELRLSSDGDSVYGDFVTSITAGFIRGAVHSDSGTVFTGEWFEYKGGLARFALRDDGLAFIGSWGVGDTLAHNDWLGTRIGGSPNGDSLSFSGTWDTKFGKVEFIRVGDMYHGTFAYDQKIGIIHGSTGTETRIIDGVWMTLPLEDTYGLNGSCRFVISEDDNTIIGMWWKPDEENGRHWYGSRKQAD